MTSVGVSFLQKKGVPDSTLHGLDENKNPSVHSIDEGYLLGVVDIWKFEIRSVCLWFLKLMFLFNLGFYLFLNWKILDKKKKINLENDISPSFRYF